MKPIDAQFRPKIDFFVAWFMIALAAVTFARPWNDGLPWYSTVAWILVVPFILTFFIYGPILLMRQVIRSGSRGWFVLRTFVSISLVAALILGVVFIISGKKSSDAGHIAAVALVYASITYLRSKNGKGEANQAPEPTPTTVTPPAGQEARQP
jgi:cation transport ATPase